MPLRQEGEKYISERLNINLGDFVFWQPTDESGKILLVAIWNTNFFSQLF